MNTDVIMQIGLLYFSHNFQEIIYKYIYIILDIGMIDVKRYIGGVSVESDCFTVLFSFPVHIIVSHKIWH